MEERILYDTGAANVKPLISASHISKAMIEESTISQSALPMRVRNVLMMNGISTVSEMLTIGRERLYSRPGFGKGIRDSLDAFFDENGIEWKL